MTGAPRVVFVVSPFGWGGAEKHLEDLLERADRGRMTPVLLAVGDHGYREALARRNIAGVELHEARPGGLTGWRRALAGCSPDTVVFVTGKFGMYPWTAYAAARLSGARRVCGLEHLQAEPPGAPPPGTGPRAWLVRRGGWHARQRWLHRLPGILAHRTVCVSDAVRDTLVREWGFPAGRTVTVLNGIDLEHHRRESGGREAARSRLGIDPGHVVAVSVARLGTLKRLDLLLDATAALAPRHPGFRCVIVGDGTLAGALREQAARLGIGRLVTFAGHQADPRPWLEAADLYVSASEREGFGLAVVEAMAHELPCVATRIGGHDQVMATPGTGILVETGSVPALVEGIERVLRDPAAAAEMGRQARRDAERRFDIRRMVAELTDVFTGAA